MNHVPVFVFLSWHPSVWSQCVPMCFGVHVCVCVIECTILVAGCHVVVTVTLFCLVLGVLGVVVFFGTYVVCM